MYVSHFMTSIQPDLYGVEERGCHEPVTTDMGSIVHWQLTLWNHSARTCPFSLVGIYNTYLVESFCQDLPVLSRRYIFIYMWAKTITYLVCCLLAVHTNHVLTICHSLAWREEEWKRVLIFLSSGSSSSFSNS
jgi:hypothetical protein